MSNAGRPSIRGNGSGVPNVPPDLPYPCTIYSCTGGQEHKEDCDGNCEFEELSESSVILANLGREFARNGMNPVGIPARVPAPIPGIEVDLIDLLCRTIAMEEIIFEHLGMNREEFDEKFRETKIEFLQTILDANKEAVKRARVANSLGIVEKRGILGPDGNPL